MSLEEELRREEDRTSMERTRSAVREELEEQLRGMESRIKSEIAERIATVQRSGSKSTTLVVFRLARRSEESPRCREAFRCWRPT